MEAYDERMKRLALKLRSLLSADGFGGKPLLYICTQLTEIFDDLVLSTFKKTTDVIHFDNAKLTKVLAENIPWSDLCRDLCPLSSLGSRFDVVINCLVKVDSQLRLRCPSALFDCILYVYLLMPPSCSALHRDRLLDALDDLLSQVPGLRTAPRINACLQTCFFDRIQHLEHAVATKRLIAHWFRSFPDERFVWIRNMLLLMACVDNLIARETRKSDRVDQRKKRKGPPQPLFNSQYWHEELSEREEDDFERKINLRPAGSNVVPLPAAQKPAARLSTVKSLWSCQVKILLDVLQFTTTMTSVPQTTIPHVMSSSDMSHSILVTVMSASSRIISPSVHFCTILLQQQLPGNCEGNVIFTAKLCWELACRTTNPRPYLALYATMINESVAFDNPGALENALSPLIQLLLTNCPRDESYRRTLYDILVRRGNMMIKCCGRQLQSSVNTIFPGESMTKVIEPTKIPKYPVRQASFQLSNPEEIAKLLSTYSENNSFPSSFNMRPRTIRQKSLRNLDDDSIIRVLSFLNYKRVVRMRGMCSSWKSLADRNVLWKGLYEKRFPASVGLSNANNWKEKFMQRHRAERAIRGRVCRSQPGWKVRLCPHCLTVLTTPHRAARHLKTHKTSCDE